MEGKSGGMLVVGGVWKVKRRNGVGGVVWLEIGICFVLLLFWRGIGSGVGEMIRWLLHYVMIVRMVK